MKRTQNKKTPTIYDDVLERDVQIQVVDGLRLMRYEVLETNKSFSLPKCQQCGAKVKTSMHCDPAVPDIIVSHKDWGFAIWLGIEFKRPVGWKWSDLRQQELWEKGMTAKCHSWEDALMAIEIFEVAHGFKSLTPEMVSRYSTPREQERIQSITPPELP